MEYYDSERLSKYIAYLDQNNLYGWAMIQCFPYGRVLEYLQKTKTLKMTFFSWWEFCYRNKGKVKYLFFNKSNAFKRNASLFYFYVFFRANVSEVKLYNISFLFIWRYTNYQAIKFFLLYLQNSKRNEK